MATSLTYPVQVNADLDSELSRWLWLVKWLLVLPHVVVLVFLWVAFGLLSVLAFFAILITGRYPRALFDFNVGVLRWSWRVVYYAYGALGTDRYPPFTLAEVPDYPAHLSIDYPEHLSRGLVLVKWWLLALPHYVVIGLFTGGGTWAATNADSFAASFGLIGVLVLVAAVVLAFSGAYPRSIFDFVLGMNRWVLRVCGYVGLMTDTYPPFRLDMGGADPAALAVAAPMTATRTAESASTTSLAAGSGAPRWTAGRIVSIVVASVLALCSLGLLGGGVAVLWADQVARDSDGYLTSPVRALSTGQFVLTSERIELGHASSGAVRVLPDRWLGTVRLRVATTNGTAVFVGVAPSSDVSGYLTGVGQAAVTSVQPRGVTYRETAGGPPSSAPAEQSFWAASSSGGGPLTLTWKPQAGSWTLVVMNADASPGVAVRADIAATAPLLGWLWVVLLVAGFVLLAVSTLILVLAIATPRRPAAVTGAPEPDAPNGA